MSESEFCLQIKLIIPVFYKLSKILNDIWLCVVNIFVFVIFFHMKCPFNVTKCNLIFNNHDTSQFSKTSKRFYINRHFQSSDFHAA